MASYAIISEGISEANMLTQLIQRYKGDNSFRYVQPEIDDQKQDCFGGYAEVIKHCTDETISEALLYSDYVVIQIDTDMCHMYLDNFSYSWNEEEIYDKIRDKLLENISHTFHNKIIFAICFNETECWFLPFFWQNNKKDEEIKEQCTNNCVFKINKELKKGYKIDTSHNKNSQNSRKAYDEIFDVLKKLKKKIKDFSTYNLGFQRFIEQLDQI